MRLIAFLTLALIGTAMAQDTSFETVLEQQKTRIMALDGVVGVGRGLCDDRPCIKVLVAEQNQALAALIGKTAGGYPIDIVITGEIKALDP